jgi:hypothetical protein
MIVTKAKAVPTLPGDPAWAALKELKLPPMEMGPFAYQIQPVYVLDLYFQQLRHNRNRPYFTEANARAIHDGKDISIRLEWEDAASDPGDRIEVQLSKDLPPGFVLYGNPAEPVTLWRWEGKAPAAAAELDATGPFAAALRPAATVTANAAYDAKTKRWAVVFTRSLAGAGAPDVPIVLGNFNPFLILMKDGSEAWPEGTRAIKPDPEDDEATIKKATDKEAARVKMEKDIETKFKDLPRHLTTWHMMRLE